MKVSQFKDYSELPLFLNAELVAKVLGDDTEGAALYARIRPQAFSRHSLP